MRHFLAAPLALAATALAGHSSKPTHTGPGMLLTGCPNGYTNIMTGECKPFHLRVRDAATGDWQSHKVTNVYRVSDHPWGPGGYGNDGKGGWDPKDRKGWIEKHDSKKKEHPKKDADKEDHPKKDHPRKDGGKKDATKTKPAPGHRTEWAEGYGKNPKRGEEGEDAAKTGPPSDHCPNGVAHHETGECEPFMLMARDADSGKWRQHHVTGAYHIPDEKPGHAGQGGWPGFAGDRGGHAGFDGFGGPRGGRATVKREAEAHPEAMAHPDAMAHPEAMADPETKKKNKKAGKKHPSVNVGWTAASGMDGKFYWSPAALEILRNMKRDPEADPEAIAHPDAMADPEAEAGFGGPGFGGAHGGPGLGGAHGKPGFPAGHGGFGGPRSGFKGGFGGRMHTRDAEPEAMADAEPGFGGPGFGGPHGGPGPAHGHGGSSGFGGPRGGAKGGFFKGGFPGSKMHHARHAEPEAKAEAVKGGPGFAGFGGFGGFHGGPPTRGGAPHGHPAGDPDFKGPGGNGAAPHGHPPGAPDFKGPGGKGDMFGGPKHGPGGQRGSW